MTGAAFIELTTSIGMGLVAIGLFATVYRIVRGPSLPDRILALDLLTVLTLAFVGIYAVRSGFSLYVDIALALGLVGFLSTVALARYLMKSQAQPEGQGEAQKPAGEGENG